MNYPRSLPQSRTRQWIETQHYTRLWREAVAARHEYPANRFAGRGLVFCVGGERLFVNFWVNLCLLRRVLKCSLPVEVWHFGPGELTPSMAALLGPLDVRIVDGAAHAVNLPRGRWRGFALKKTAVIQSSFRELIFLDADSFPVRDPAFLFEEPGYRWTGACFWPDIVATDPRSAMWSILDIPYVREAEWESGQMVVNKCHTWRALSLAGHLSRHFPFHYRHMYGDKMAFYAAWKKLDQPYAMPSLPARLVAAPDSRMLTNQYDFRGDLLFQHRTNADWSLSRRQPAEWRGSVHETACVEFLQELHAKWPAPERNCKPSRGGKRARPSLWKGLAAAWQNKKRIDDTPRVSTVPLVDQNWDATARQALLTPGITSPRLMGAGIEALEGSTGEEARAIFRFLAVLIFIDPRLAIMLPEYLDTEGTALEQDWNALVTFRDLVAKRPGKTNLLNVRGNLFSLEHPPLLEPGEISVVRQLAGLLGNSHSNILAEWRTYWSRLGVEMEDATPPPHQSTAKPWKVKSRGGKVLVLTPIKNAADLAEAYCQRLLALNYPPHLLSLGLLESDSSDGTYEAFDRNLGGLRRQWTRVGLWKEDCDYHIPEGAHRWEMRFQLERRKILARGRNALLRRALKDEDWVLWLDADVIEYPCNIIQQLLSYGKDILHPHCVFEYGGLTFDRNGWRDRGRVTMDSLRGKEILAPLDALGGTMLWIRADLHRRGLIFPEEPYGRENPRVREPADCFDPQNPGELETEGLGIMASDMGVQCWGLPELEILHRKK